MVLDSGNSLYACEFTRAARRTGISRGCKVESNLPETCEGSHFFYFFAAASKCTSCPQVYVETLCWNSRGACSESSGDAAVAVCMERGSNPPQTGAFWSPKK